MANKNKKLERIYQLLNEMNSTFCLYDREVYLKTCRIFQFDEYNSEYTVAGSIHLYKERKDQPLGYVVVRVSKEALKSFPYVFEKGDLKLTEKGLSVFVKRKEVGKVVLDNI